jgi:hypothetical protein
MLEFDAGTDQLVIIEAICKWPRNRLTVLWEGHILGGLATRAKPTIIDQDTQGFTVNPRFANMLQSKPSKFDAQKNTAGRILAVSKESLAVIILIVVKLESSYNIA